VGTFGRLSGNDDDVAMDGNDYDNLDNYDDGDDDTSLRGFRVNVKSTADAVGASANASGGREVEVGGQSVSGPCISCFLGVCVRATACVVNDGSLRDRSLGECHLAAHTAHACMCARSFTIDSPPSIRTPQALLPTSTNK